MSLTRSETSRTLTTEALVRRVLTVTPSRRLRRTVASASP